MFIIVIRHKKASRCNLLVPRLMHKILARHRGMDPINTKSLEQSED
jgi:hypothetical protein